MTTLFEQLIDRPYNIFSRDELNEPLLSIYISIAAAIRDNCDTLTLHKIELIRSKNNNVIGTIRLSHGKDSIFEIMREALLKVYERDELIRKYFDLEMRPNKELTLNRLPHEGEAEFS
jgi:hypothetical protein